MSSNTYTVTTRAVSGGKRTSGTGASASAGGFAPASSGVTEHSELSGRGQQDQHPMSAVTGLSAVLIPNDNGISLRLVSPDGTKARVLSIDNNGRLCIDGDVEVSGDVAVITQ